MTQLLDPTSAPGICIWDEDVPCDVPLIDLDTSGYAHAPACTISNFCDMPPVAPIPLPGGLALGMTALAALAVMKWRQADD